MAGRTDFFLRQKVTEAELDLAFELLELAPEFVALLTQVADHVDVAPALVENDYWITHSLWALHETKLAIWFKGGTSLSKGLGIVECFTEDLDLMIERGGVTTLVLDDPEQRASVARAYAKIAPMFWAKRMPLDEACATIRGWVGALRG